MNPEFWLNKRVFLTGHTGFKGSWISLWLQLMGSNVLGYALAPNTNPSLFNLAQVSSGMTSIFGDINDPKLLKKTMQNFKPDIVIHMAAQALVRYSYANPIDTFRTNIMGTVNLLEAARNTNSIRAIINVTSDKCYQNTNKNSGYIEDDSLGGFDPYSSSKSCSEIVTDAYRKSYFNEHYIPEHKVGIATARAGNVIGGGDWSTDRLIPDFLRSMADNKPIIIRKPNSVRPWQSVLDALSGYLLLGELLYNQAEKYSEAWNFGPDSNNEQQVEWIVKNLIKNWEYDPGYEIKKELNKLHETDILKLNCSKAKKGLGWSSKLDIEDTLKDLCDWHKLHLKGENMRKISIRQINKYMEIN
tara:strand:+ start:16026 stop:17099 length:1074 start_codon:yes stop_codon:yes gene_type:complete